VATNDNERVFNLSDVFPVDRFTDGSEVILEAFNLVNGARQIAYSHPLDDYTKVRNLFEAVTGVSLTVEQAILFMVCVKLSRLRTNLEKSDLHMDSLVDAIGYLGCLSMAVTQKERTKQNGNTRLDS
jgi:hypothetical protein